MSSHYTPTSQRGLSLIELMISMTLSIILTFGAVQIYVSSKQTYRSQDAMSRMQENARYALDIVVKDIRSSGYVGCGNLTTVTPNVVTASPTINAYSATTAFTGNQNTGAQVWSPVLAAGVSLVVDDTDVFTVQNAGRCSTTLAADMAAIDSNVTIATANSCGFSQNDVILISDCNKADLFRITNAPAATGLLSHADLSDFYLTSAATQVMSVNSSTYFIRNDATSGIPSLYALDNTQAAGGNNPLALIEGVENMQVQYGIDTNNDGAPEQYSDANAVTDWTQVVSARITLLMRTMEAVDAAAYTFSAGGTTKTYDDGIMRKEFVATVKLRNKGLL
jgi:type IV pilus assembly protein PilW